jgi:hypothetical protein
MEIGNVIREFNKRGEVIFEGLILKIDEEKNSVYLKIKADNIMLSSYNITEDGSVAFGLSYMKKCLERDDHVLLK